MRVSPRPQFQAVVQLVESRQIDGVVAWDLSRFSRDQEDTAWLYKRCQYHRVKLLTLQEGEITHLHVGMKGTSNAMYLSDLAANTRKGLRRVVEKGKSGGGKIYGYRTAPDGQLVRDDAQAQIVLRIFEAYVHDTSPRAIAKQLNREGIPGPQGGAWIPSTIHGHRQRGTGILNNELYLGRRIWNRLRYVKHPDSGKRVSQLNPRASGW